MNDRQVRMLCGVILVLAGGIVFAGGMNDTTPPLDEGYFGIVLALIGLAVFGIEYLRSWKEELAHPPDAGDA